ncbi:MAG: ABC transporter permease [Tepidisphaeraceae bacterium]
MATVSSILDSQVVPRKPLLTLRPSSGWSAINFRDTWMFRDLMLSLGGRDLRLRYRQTALGVAWVILQPLMAAGIFTFVFGLVAKLPAGKSGYFMQTYASLLGWNAFFATITKTSGCLLQNAPLVSKVYFPRLVLPLSTVFSTLVDFAIALGLMIVMMPLHHIGFTYGILLIPIWLAMLILMAMGIGLYAAALGVSYRDVQYVIPVLTQLLMYASPVGYTLDAVPARFRTLVMLNPLSGLLEAFRWSLLGTSSSHWMAILYSTLVAFIAFFAGAIAFRRMERKFTDVI